MEKPIHKTQYITMSINKKSGLRRSVVVTLVFLLSLLTFQTFGQLAAWNPAGISGTSGGPSPWAATSSNGSLTVGGLTRGAGTTTNNGLAAFAWGGTNWLGGATQDVTFTITANAGYQVSYSSFNLFYRRSTTGPASGVLQYAFGGTSTSYTTIGSFNFSSTSSAGANHAPISLTGIANLQNVAPGTVVRFRIFPAAGTSSGGTWYVYNSGLSILGSVTAAAPSYTASISTASPIPCNGLSSGALTASVTGSTPPYTYSWSPAGGTSSVATGLSAGTYSCFVTSATSETTFAIYTLSEPAMLSSSVSGLNNVTCNGGSNGSVTVNASGGTPPFIYTWMPAGGSGSNATNLTAGEYTVNVSDSKSCTTQTISITEPATIIAISANTSNSVICNGSTITLTGAGANTYTWTGGATDGTAFSPSTSATYSLPVQIITVARVTHPFPLRLIQTPTITVNSGAICPGNAFVLTPGGANTYTFSSATATVMPTTLTSYSVYGTSIDGCESSVPAISTVTVTASLSVTISGPTSICIGDAANLTANGANSYTWSTNEFNYTIAPTPSVNTTYSVLGISGSCSNSAVTTISVNPLPIITINGSSVICSGETATLTTGGASTYSWSSTETTSIITQMPATNTLYVVIGTDANGCSNLASQSVTVYPTPTITVANGTICSGGSFTFNPSGASTYTFSGGTVVSPTITTSYSVTATNSLGCTSPTAVPVSITVNTLPVIAVNSGTLCLGKTFTMIPAGAFSYTFSNGSSTASPTINTSYSVTGTNSLGCISSSPAISNVTVYTLPSITVSNGTVCAGKTFTMIPAGASSYTYSNGASTVIPTTNTSYSVTGTSSLGCVSSTAAVASVTVNPVPVIATNNGTLCSGSVFTIIPTGASTYTFSNGSATVSPTITTSYYVSGTNSLGCISTGSVISMVTVVSLPLITVNNGTMCAGSIFTMVPGGASTYTFSNNSATVSPATLTSYSVSGTNSVGCISSGFAISTVTVYTLPTLSITASSSLCNGSSLNLGVSGANTYTWSTNSHSTVIMVTPSVSTTYSVTGTSTNGCLSSSNQSITVFPSPTINLSGGSVCPGGTFTLTPSGASTYTYSGGQIVSPSVTTTYSVTGTSTAGCISLNSATAVVTVTNSLLVSISATTLVCGGAPATITASGASTYTWNTGAIGSTFVPTPSVNTTYSVTGSSGTCSNTAVISISVLPTPTVTVVSSNTAICSGQSASLTASGATSYTWTGGIINGTAFSPTVTTTYTVFGEGTNGCVGSVISLLVVNANPTISATSSNSLICTGEKATLTASGALTYNWSIPATTTSAAIVSPSATTSYTVTGTDINGCATSTMLSQHVSNCTAINSQSEKTQAALSIFPNPNSGDFIIKSELHLHLILINEFGQLIRSIDFNGPVNQEVLIKELDPGVYFVRSVSPEISFNQKIIVTR